MVLFHGMTCSRILLVEDDKNIRELFRELLESEGFVVDTCVNGHDAVAFLDHHQDPCLILLDMMMPIMNGREFMKEFTKRPHAIAIAPIPVVLVSASANGFLKKPFDIDVLLAIVRTYCKVDINRSKAS